MKPLIIFIFLLNLILVCSCDEIENKLAKINYAKKLNSLYSDLISGQYNNDINKFLSAKSGNFDNDRCNTHLGIIMDQLSNNNTSNELWANEMFDASGKVTDGILYGNRYSWGNYDQCIGILGHDDNGTIKGQYCLTTIISSLDSLKELGSNLPLGKLLNPKDTSVFVTMHGVCVPDSCEPAYFFQVFQGILLEANLYVAPVDDPGIYCTTDNPIELAAIDIVAIVIFTIVIAFMIASTVYDVYTTNTKQPKRDLFMAFSVLTNGKRMFSVERSKSPDVMNCLNGIRVLSLVWIVMGHGYGVVSSSVMNFAYIAQWQSNVYSMLIMSTPLAVDSFFLLSGLLVTYNVFKEMNKTNGKLNILMMYVHRYLRLTPPLAMTVLLAVSFIIHTGLGPISYLMYQQIEFCERYWWSTLLYVQNYVNPRELCLEQTWYLQVDMQLFLLSPLILIPLWKWGRNVLPVVFGIMFLSIGCHFATVHVNFNKVIGGRTYSQTHLRMSVWMIGVALAYAIIKSKNRKLEFPKWLVYGAWTLSIGLILVPVFGPYNIQQPDYVPTAFESSLHQSVNRIAWSIALSWIIFACVKGYGGFVNHFLSHPIWLPFARMSYSMYLLSLTLQMYRTKIAKTGKYFNDYEAINLCWGDIGVTFTVAIFWVLAFESPVPILEKVLFSRKPKPQLKLKELEKVEIPN